MSNVLAVLVLARVILAALLAAQRKVLWPARNFISSYQNNGRTILKITFNGFFDVNSCHALWIKINSKECKIFHSPQGRSAEPAIHRFQVLSVFWQWLLLKNPIFYHSFILAQNYDRIYGFWRDVLGYVHILIHL